LFELILQAILPEFLTPNLYKNNRRNSLCFLWADCVFKFRNVGSEQCILPMDGYSQDGQWFFR